MPKGRKKKAVKGSVTDEGTVIVDSMKDKAGMSISEVNQVDMEEPKEMPQKEEKPVEPKKQVLDPLEPTQQYFEAPDGTVMTGEKSADRLWYRKGNGGNGMWINPMRR